MFEGYAGTSDSGFRAEVESEQALARGENLLAMIDQHEHKTLAGPAGEEAQHRLEQFGEQAHNVALTTDNTTAWRAEITTINRRLTGKPPLPPLLADRLRARRTTITDFLARHDLEQQ